MIYAYIRVSSDRQSVKNQKFEILKFANGRKLHVDEWVEETVSGTRRVEERGLGQLLERVGKGDVLVVTEISRLGRSLMEVMGLLHGCMEREIRVFTIKEGHEFGNKDNISSQVLAFAFGLSAQIERDMISQRTKEALARKRSEGVKLGRPKGSRAKKTKLSGKEGEIKVLLEKRVPVSVIGRMFGVHRLTVERFILGCQVP